MPYEVQEALRIFNLLPPAFAGMGFYIGKDIAPIQLFFDVYEVPVESRRAVFDLVIYLVDRSIRKANQEIEKERKKTEDAEKAVQQPGNVRL